MSPERSDGQISLFGVAEPAPGGTARGPEAAGERSPRDPGPARRGRTPIGEPGEAPGTSAETAISVSDLNAAARGVLEDVFPALWVTGEVADWRQPSSGHCYFSLRDEDARVRCVMFRGDARRLPTEPEDGMEVCVRGEVSLYEARGDFQLIVREVEAKGEGLWRLAFERLRRKLAEEGLLDPDRKRSIPRVPATVGVVTSRTGAALRDVVTVVRRRAPWTRILVSHCRVQGDGAADDVAAAIDRLVRFGGVDVLVVTRGGGSMEDLWAFNEEPVARAVANCPVPVVSAVGHEVDVTICDLVADRRAPTPSAAAEVAVADGRALWAELRGLAERLVAGLRERTRRGGERTERAAERLFGSVDRRLERWRSRVERLAGRLEALSPLGTLRRGYAVPLSEGGRVLRRRGDFSPGERVRLRVVDGRVGCEVTDVEALPGEGTG